MRFCYKIDTENSASLPRLQKSTQMHVQQAGLPACCNVHAVSMRNAYRRRQTRRRTVLESRRLRQGARAHADAQRRMRKSRVSVQMMTVLSLPCNPARAPARVVRRPLASDAEAAPGPELDELEALGPSNCNCCGNGRNLRAWKHASICTRILAWSKTMLARSPGLPPCTM